MFLDPDGNRVIALDFGGGPRTLLAHGGWVGHFEDWIATLAPLSASWRTAVCDHPGCGETQVPAGRITVEALVDAVFRVTDAPGIERCVLAGFWRGVSTVLRAVLRHPGRFDGLGRRVGFEGSGHVPAMTRPRDVAHEVDAFLRAPPRRWRLLRASEVARRPRRAAPRTRP